MVVGKPPTERFLSKYLPPEEELDEPSPKFALLKRDVMEEKRPPPLPEPEGMTKKNKVSFYPISNYLLSKDCNG